MAAAGLAPHRPGSLRLPRSTAVQTVLATGLAVLVVLVVLAVRARGHDGTAPTSTAMPRSLAMESSTGVRFTQVGMSSDGGMVDVRWQAVDADKSMTLAQTFKTQPYLIDERTHRALYAIAFKPHVHDIHPGGRYYLLYRNTADSVHAGDVVTIRLDGRELHHVPVLGQRR